jgi:glutamate-ammonia-ligase adenylyltransferase
MLALFRLRAKKFLSDREYARLAAAYQFLRHLEHRLQFFEDRQTHTLPPDTDQLHTLARRMPESSFHEATAGSLQRELDDHLAAVRELYDRVIHSPRADSALHIEPPLSNLTRFLDSQAPSFMDRLRSARLGHGQERLDHFLEKIAGDPAHLHLLEADTELTRATFDFFEHSPYFSDQLIRHPELLAEIEKACGDRQGRDGFEAPEDPTELRRFYRRQMVRIQSDSVYHAVDVYRTLKRTSALADSVIGAAYRTAIAETFVSNPPRGALYTPLNQMTVIALGRLGMHEFDLASDADLAFALPDRDASEMPFWTAVAERLIHIISAYTGDGVVFTVDTRLRPNGRAGDLVQTESMYKNYFGQRAEAWEGIAYMKARAVAGDTDRGTQFLNEIQEVDWRRYGQNGRSRQALAEMRARIEREQSPRNPLKAGPGGYYDIDFALLYLRLKGAGIFFRVLNTPERIDVVEKTGHLDREDAEFLREAATFYRAIDHGMRVATGHADGTIPTAPARRVILGELVRRWSPRRFQSGDDLLKTPLARVRAGVRAFFDRVFH